MFRVSPETHRKAAVAAELSGKSLNQWAEEVLERATAPRIGAPVPRQPLYLLRLARRKRDVDTSGNGSPPTA